MAWPRQWFEPQPVDRENLRALAAGVKQIESIRVPAPRLRGQCDAPITAKRKPAERR